MNNQHKGVDLIEEIRRHIKFWHERNAMREVHLEEADRRARQHPDLGTRYIKDVVINTRNGFRSYFRSNYGYEIGLEDDNPPSKSHIVNLERMPSSSKEWQQFFNQICELAVCEIAFSEMLPVLEASSLTDEALYRLARKEYNRYIMDMYDICIVKSAVGAAYKDGRIDVSALTEKELAALAGWVGSQIKKYPRLSYALQKEASSSYSRFLQELPTTTFLETDNLYGEGEGDKLYREGDMLHNLTKRVSKNLANGGGRTSELARDRRRVNNDDAFNTIADESMLQEFSTKENVIALKALKDSARLSNGECQVLELILRDYSDRQIASELGKTEGTVKTLKHRLRKKYKKAAGQ